MVIGAASPSLNILRLKGKAWSGYGEIVSLKETFGDLQMKQLEILEASHEIICDFLANRFAPSVRSLAVTTLQIVAQLERFQGALTEATYAKGTLQEIRFEAIMDEASKLERMLTSMFDAFPSISFRIFYQSFFYRDSFNPILLADAQHAEVGCASPLPRLGPSVIECPLLGSLNVMMMVPGEGFKGLISAIQAPRLAERAVTVNGGSGSALQQMTGQEYSKP